MTVFLLQNVVKATSEPNPLVKSILLKLNLMINFYKDMYVNVYKYFPISVAARSTGWVCGSSLAGNAGSNSTGGYRSLSCVSVECCQEEVSETG